jgi:hypothetical protein
MNDQGKSASVALKTYQKETGSDAEDIVSDLLADLMHLCDKRKIDFEAELERARYHYEAEKHGEFA